MTSVNDVITFSSWLSRGFAILQVACVLGEEMARNLTLEEKEMVNNVSAYFELEAQSGKRSHVMNVASRTSTACAVSERTVKRCRRLARNGVYREERRLWRKKKKQVHQEWAVPAIRSTSS